MTVNLDWVASVLSGLCALIMFTFHVVTSPQRKHWISLPEYIRTGIFLTGALFMWRSANFTVIAGDSEVELGHINAEGLLLLTCLTYVFGALAFHIVRRTYPPRVWQRLGYIAELARRHPKDKKRSEAIAMLALRGVYVTRPNASPTDFVESLNTTGSSPGPEENVR